MILIGDGQSACIEECPNAGCDAEDIRAGGPYTDHDVTVGLDEPTNVEPDIICPECNAIITVEYKSGRVQVGQRGFRGLGISQPHTRIYGATAEEPRPGVIEHRIEENGNVEEVAVSDETPEERSAVQRLLDDLGADDLSPLEDYDDAMAVAELLREGPDEQPLNVSQLELEEFIREKAEARYA